MSLFSVPTILTDVVRKLVVLGPFFRETIKVVCLRKNTHRIFDFMVFDVFMTSIKFESQKLYTSVFLILRES